MFLVPSHCGQVFLVGESGTVAPLLTSAASLGAPPMPLACMGGGGGSDRDHDFHAFNTLGLHCSSDLPSTVCGVTRGGTLSAWRAQCTYLGI